jgi:hypothetical protein
MYVSRLAFLAGLTFLLIVVFSFVVILFFFPESTILGESFQKFLTAFSALSSMIVATSLLYFQYWTIQQRTPNPVIANTSLRAPRPDGLTEGEGLLLRITVANPGDGIIYILSGLLTFEDRTLAAEPDSLLPPHSTASFEVELPARPLDKRIDELMDDDYRDLRLELIYISGLKQKRRSYGVVGRLALAQDGVKFIPYLKLLGKKARSS